MYKHIINRVKKEIRVRSVVLFGALFTVFMFSACSIGGGGSPEDLGVFRSTDYGESYEQANKLPDDKNLNETSIFEIVADTFNPNLMFLGTLEKGMLKSTNGGDLWEQTGQQEGTFYGIAIDPKNNRQLYAAGYIDTYGKILRSGNGGQDWHEVYREGDPEIKVFDVVVDHFDTRNIYATNQNGVVIKSEDYGENWVVINRLDGRAIFLRMSPFDSRILFVASPDFGIVRTLDGGETWEEIRINEDDFSGANKIYDLQFHPTEPNTILIGSQYGLLRSPDLGATWESIPLLTTPGENALVRLAIDPENPDNMYLSIDTSMYKSTDAGAHWKIQKVTTSFIYSLLIKPEQPDTLFAGIWYKPPAE
ncbi:hypothetical protein KKH43_04255 [Patescibacteria group bacterium]|nr:hypothetical protein [Patescibacteria group bacterium]